VTAASPSPELPQVDGNETRAPSVHGAVNDSTTTFPTTAPRAGPTTVPQAAPTTVHRAATRPTIEPTVPPAAVPVAGGFDEFYAAHSAPVARALALTIGDADLAAEATDEAMVRAYQRWHQVSGYSSPGGWVYRVGLNWARSVLRRRRRGQRLAVYATPPAGAPVVGEPAVAAALAELNVDQRAVVVCRFLLDWSVDETAAALGVRPGTVQSRLHRAVQQLQSRLSHLR
jgi:DNA-directed RNA polymerase specialized sigma24 family protein